MEGFRFVALRSCIGVPRSFLGLKLNRPRSWLALYNLAIPAVTRSKFSQKLYFSINSKNGEETLSKSADSGSENFQPKGFIRHLYGSD